MRLVIQALHHSCAALKEKTESGLGMRLSMAHKCASQHHIRPQVTCNCLLIESAVYMYIIC